MGVYLNPSNAMFKRAVDSEIYVDKSMLISFTNSKINTEQEFICVSRPRRFGKSIAANMLAAYYDRLGNSRELFGKYKIAEDESFEKYLNKYDVIHLELTDFISNGENVEKMLKKIYDRLLFELKKTYPDAEIFPDATLAEVFECYYRYSGTPFIFIIDEWDCVLRSRDFSEEDNKIFLNFIRNIFKGKSYAALVYMTGILPIKKYGEHSALNMFDEYSMTEQSVIKEFTGFTEEEVKALCEEYDMSFEETRQWYDGYNVDGISIYNPRSVVTSMLRHSFGSYWSRTETYDALKIYIEMNFDGLRDKVIELIAGKKLPVDTSTFQNDMVELRSADDVLTLLVHLGYLTFDTENNVWIPNNEVRKEYISSIKNGGWENVMKLINKSEELLKAVLEMNEKKTAELLEQVHQDNTSILKYNDENALSCTIALAFYAANKDYILHRELAGGKGYADLVFIPRKNAGKPALIVELKKDDTAENALKQIEERNYTDSVKGLTGEILLVGISYDGSKHHECKIKKINI